MSHELKTPIAVLRTSLVTLEKRLKHISPDSWQPSMDRARRNLDRLLEMQYQVDDIMQDKTYKSHLLLSQLLDRCTDELEALVAEEFGEGPIVERFRNRIEDIYGARQQTAEKVQMDLFINDRLKYLRPFFVHRQIDVVTQLDSTPLVYIPLDALQKVFDGLLKNAIENTPDEGKIEIVLSQKGEGTLLEVRDFGVGITKENQTRIFEGFFTTQETLDYSSKKPYDFNAGGKGADLLRMKIFSERYKFKIELTSTRCPFIPKDSDTCPGRISECSFCNEGQGCHQEVATTFSLYFPPVPQKH